MNDTPWADLLAVEFPRQPDQQEQERREAALRRPMLSTNLNIDEMRHNYEVWRAAWKALHADGCTPECLPVVTWGGREYAVVRGPRLIHGTQQVEVIDLTDFDRLGDGHRAARFAQSWPEQGDFPTFDEETPEQIKRRIRRWVIYRMPDEGHCTLVTEDGSSTRWCDAWTMSFPVSVVPIDPTHDP